ncbi:Forkhead-associated (FHA) domain [Dillenia turbinata]|uniref:Forkhead-associated (FHA) domain n=1 Tax=Dillenia turbinata TaxID=194707 RepID=A0AAN8V1Q1_9MAGN
MARYSSESPPRRRDSSQKRSSFRLERSPDRHKSSRTTRSPEKVKSSHRERTPAPEKHSSHHRSSKHNESRSPQSRSPSPRTKRMRRAEAEREAEKVNVKEYEKNGSRDKENPRHTEKGLGQEAPKERSERRSTRDRDGDSSRTRRDREHERPSSPLDREHPKERNERRLMRDGVSDSFRTRHERDRERSSSPSDHCQRSRYDSRSPRRASKASTLTEVLLWGSVLNLFQEIFLVSETKVADSRGTEQHQVRDDDSVAKMKAAEEALETKQKQKPSFELSGKLAAETNRMRGVTLLFTEPPDARKPDVRWRLYVFKAGEVLNEPLYIHRQSCYLFGRERRVADVPTDHPSCSKQHAVIQFRQVEKEQPDGMLAKQVRPYLMDLGSTNGTFINDNRIEPQRYYELIEKDTMKFGNSSREYVILHENSAE